MMAATAAETYYEGYLVKVTTNAVTIIEEDGDATVGVVDQSTVDAEGTARAARSGELIGVFPLGCGEVVKVASKASQTYALGARVVNSDDVDGMSAATGDSDTDMIVGTYVGDGETTSATDGDLIDVLLNFGPEVVDG